MPSKRAKPKKQPRPDLLHGRDHVSQLYRAVRRYIQHYGGSLAVIGGVEILRWPSDLDNNFSVAVRCTGKLPVFSQPEAKDAE